ncbi:purine/pyrimidine permease [Bacillus licheniformis]|nr:purine/pyrimidine permease [Bacillus licheniformis]
MFDSGLVVTSLFITVLLIVNMLASIRVVEGAVKQFEKLEERKRARPAGFIASVSHLLSGLLGAVGTVPISGAAGFIQTTRMSSKNRFARESDRNRHQLLPAGHEYFASLPSPVGLR